MKLLFSFAANDDLANIWQHNATTYGHDHADRYQDFLLKTISGLSEFPQMGPTAINHPDIRVLYIKWKRSAKHGHHAYYRIINDCISIERILHSAMDHNRHLIS